MPRYEYRCRACGDTFEINRPMSESGARSTCPAGHDDTVKLLSTISLTGSAASSGPSGSASTARPPATGGGCCGGACGC